jgi:sugar/nucleoside kinase (ribokinase family)
LNDCETKLTVDFKYLTSKKRLEASDLTPELLRSKSFHMVCAPRRAVQIVSETTARIEAEFKGRKGPIWLWEPVPEACCPDEVGNTLETIKMIDVVSPNHQELGLLFGVDVTKDDGETIDHAKIIELSRRLLSAGIGEYGKGTIVVRCGKDGCYFSSRRESGWIPAYHTDPSKVVDPTGGGNSFLGALAISLARDELLELACIKGSIAASFVIEQIGMPGLTRSAGEEMWNGTSPTSRFNEFMHRLVNADDNKT